MCSDLISRKMVMEFLQQRHAGAIIEGCHAGSSMEELLYGGIQSEVRRIMDFIVQAPDAYDVDEVVKQLEECKRIMESPVQQDCFGEECKIGDCTVCAFEKAIEIAKAGGVDG